MKKSEQTKKWRDYKVKVCLFCILIFSFISICEASEGKLLFSLELREVYVGEIPQYPDEYEIGKDISHQYLLEHLEKNLWVRKKASLSISSQHISSIEIHNYDSKPYDITVSIHPSSKVLMNKIYEYTKKKKKERVAVLVGNKIIALPTIMSPVKEAMTMTILSNDIDEIKKILIKISPNIKVIDHDKRSLHEKNGDKLFRKHNFLKASIEYSNALKNDQKSKSLLFKRGFCYGTVGQHLLAINDFSEAIEIDSSFDLAFSQRGLTWVKTNNYENAISDYKTAIRLSPSNSSYYNNLAWLLATCKDSQYRNGKHAVLLARKAIELSGATEIYDTLAAAYAEVGNFEAAIDIIKSNIKVFTKNNRVNDLHKAQKKLKSYEESKPWREIHHATKN